MANSGTAGWIRIMDINVRQNTFRRKENAPEKHLALLWSSLLAEKKLDDDQYRHYAIQADENPKKDAAVLLSGFLGVLIVLVHGCILVCEERKMCQRERTYPCR
jgi:hypothetical protein